MKPFALVLLPVLALLCGCGTDPAVDKEAVSKTFDKYRTAILAANGEAAAEAVSQKTFDEYQKYVDWAKTADRATVESLSPLKKMQVLALRHRVPRDNWKDITTGKAAFIYGVNNDWIGKRQVAGISLGQINICVMEAAADAMMNKTKTPLRFYFHKEHGDWKLDLVPAMEAADAAMKFDCKRKKKSEDQYIFDALEAVSGRKLTESVWDPIKI